MTRLPRLVLAAALSAALPGLALAGPVTASGAWVRATPPGAMAAGGFLTLHNPGPGDDRLVGARSPAAARVELHGMEMSGGVMRMHPLAEGLPLPAGATVALAPGGAHIMMMDLAAPVVVGAPVPVTLILDSGAEIAVQMQVVPPGAPKPAEAQ
ncbi:copper chaperone PCu(A)C (plasmid) [Paroceanicella profunda]|uniref:Copper chaperone PCu(A)C n=1 Tax=Paroceanicella profunda TaxID=2579971 RepID=A0A5B8FJ66_9RHOB|nr:copper chaperone PCu(A)C [Paroceanicella profunda]QDL94571.1 copper chaperone PCu(A)C [Paroceanicella profunda]